MRMSDSRIAADVRARGCRAALHGGPGRGRRRSGPRPAGRDRWWPLPSSSIRSAFLTASTIPKVLDAEERERLYVRITATAMAIGVGIGDVERIDRDNILAATLWAMARRGGASSR